MEREIKDFSKQNPKTNLAGGSNDFSTLIGVALKAKQAEGWLSAAERAFGAESKTAAPSFGSRK